MYSIFPLCPCPSQLGFNTIDICPYQRLLQIQVSEILIPIPLMDETERVDVRGLLLPHFTIPILHATSSGIRVPDV
jgi:hypothetical protein